MKGKNSLLTIIVIFFLASLCFFFNSYIRINRLNEKTVELERTLFELEVENRNLNNFLASVSLKAKKDYLYQKGFINSNEILVDIEVPPLPVNNGLDTNKINYLILTLSVLFLCVMFIVYLFKRKATLFKRRAVFGEIVVEDQKIH